MNILELSSLLEQGAYQDMPLSEYQFTKRFAELTNPQKVTVVGGYTNLDLFYSLQNLVYPQVVNFDPGDGTLTETSTRNKQKEYQKQTGFQGKYQWIPQSLSSIANTDTDVDLLWVNCLQETVVDIQKWPQSLILHHEGRHVLTKVILQITKHIPLVALGRRIAVYSNQNHDWQHKSYHSSQTGQLGHIKFLEIIK